MNREIKEEVEKIWFAPEDGHTKRLRFQGLAERLVEDALERIEKAISRGDGTERYVQAVNEIVRIRSELRKEEHGND